MSPTRTQILRLVILGLLLAGCQAAPLQFRPPLENEGAVYLYLQPFPQEAERLSFGVDAVSAIRGDGRELPLSVSLRELRGREVKRQRLFAAGALPPDEYVGFSLRTTFASLRGEAGESALLVPEAATKIDFKFSVNRQTGYVISLLLRYPQAVEAGFQFSPDFSLFFPERPPVNLMGFVTNAKSNDISLFDRKSLRVFGVIPTGRGPSGMALDQRLRRAYVALSGEDSVEIIDVAAGIISERIQLNPGDEPQELALTPDGKTLLVANTGSNVVGLVDAMSRLEVTRIRAGNGPRSIVIDPTGRRAFVFNTMSNTISVIDIPNRGLITTIATDPGPLRGQFNRRGDKLYVVHEASPYVVVIDPQSLSVTGRLAVRTGTSSAKVDASTDLVYLGRKRDVVVGVHDPFSFAAVGFVHTGATITHMAADGDENTLLMVSPDTKSVLVSNLISKGIVGEMDVGEGPYWVTLMGER
jgi:YVTN family beta-propeller protein